MPNSLSNGPHQNINCALDHYDYLVKLVPVEHVGIGRDTLVAITSVSPARRVTPRWTSPAFAGAYLNGLESPADGKNVPWAGR